MSTTHTAVFENAILKSTELKADTKIAVGLDTEQTTKELTVVGDAPEIRIQDKTGSNPEVNQTTLSIVADGGVTHFRAGTSTFDTTETKGDIKFQSSTGDSTHAIITGTGRVGVGTMAPTESLDIVGNINLQKVSNTATIKLDSNVVTEFTRSKKLIKYPRVAMTAATTSGYTASASSENNGTTSGQAWRAFDGVAGGERGYHSNVLYSNGVYTGSASVTDVNNTVYDGEWIKLQLPTGERIKVMGAYFYPRTEGNTGYVERTPYKGYILGSNTGSNGSWNLITSFDGIISTVSSPGIYMFNNNTNDYYNHIALVANEVSPGTHGIVLNFAELEYFALPEYDPEAHGTDTIMRSAPNVPTTDWLEVYYDGQDYTSMPATVTDKSGNGVTGTPNGVTFDSTWKAFSFDGVDDYIRGTIPGVADDYIHSISLWIKLAGTNDGIFEISGATRAANSVIGLYVDADGTLAYYFFNNDARYNTNLQIGQWYHVGLTYHGSGERRVYVNGSQPSFKTSYGTLTNPLTLTGGTLTIGSRIDLAGNYFNGSIANFRFFNRALTADEIWQLYAYQKEYFQVSPDVVTFKGGRLGIGTMEPKDVLHIENGGIHFNSPIDRRNTDDGVSIIRKNLSYYEEGEWTPYFGAVSTPTYTRQTGYYTRIGNIVHISFMITVSAINNGDSSGVHVTGIPFRIYNNVGEPCSVGLTYESNLFNSNLSNGGGRIGQNVLLFTEAQGDTIRYNDCASSGTLRGFATYTLRELL